MTTPPPPTNQPTRVCRNCRGRGETLAHGDDWRAWLAAHDDLVVERARVAAEYQAGRASRAELVEATFAVDMHLLAAPIDLCDACCGAGDIPRRTKIRIRRRPGWLR